MIRVAHFTILGKLGQGGMGVVYRAEDTKLGRRVALKLLRPEDVADPERRARFVREARSAALVTHPNIATVYEIGEDEAGRVFIAMELVEGTTLRERLASQGPLPVAAAVTLMREITRGLAKAHAEGLVHRDLKPDNLMLDDEGAVKILDFGLAKIRELTSPSVLALAVTGEHDASPVTEAGQVMGTPGYMSPEQTTGKSVEPSSDVFALGVVLFEMLTGKLPFRGSTVGELLVAGVRDEPRSLRELAPDVSDELVGVVMACLAKSPDERPHDARALHQRLVDVPASAAFAATERAAVTDPPPADAPAPVPPPKRRRSARVFIPLLVVVAIGFVVAFGKKTAPKEIVASDAGKGMGLLDLPPPEHCNEAARAEYRSALEASRGRGLEFGRSHFELAIKADPQCPAAHLRAALHSQSSASAREHYTRAGLLRDGLSVPDRELLDAFAPVFTQEPANYEEFGKRLAVLEQKRPRDAELLIFIGFTLWAHDSGSELARYGARVLAIDPGFTAGWQLVGVAKIKAGDNEGARRAFEECDRTIPSTVDCVYEEVRLAQSTGRCADMDRDARTLATRLPSGERNAFGLLARALAANNEGHDAVAEALRQAAASSPQRATRAQLESVRLALAYGEFDRALAALAEVEKAIDGSDNLAQHATAAQIAFELNLELGHPETALAAAQGFAARQRAWSGSVSEIYGSGEEGFLLVPRMLGLQLAAGTITAERRDAELTAWISKREIVGDPRTRWIARYAATAQTVADAEQAVAVIPRDDASGAVMATVLGLPSALVGRILTRGGRSAEGIEELRRFTQRCDRLDQPIAQTQAFLWLGEALEASAPADACVAYGVVRTRWPDPRSSSSRRAAERIKALGCQRRDE